MNIVKSTIAVLTAALLLSACASGESKDKESTTESAENTASETAESTQTASSEPEKLPETDEEWHQAMIDRSLTSFGDVSKMQEKLKAAQNGEKLNISYLGGSITEGMTVAPGNPELCWANLTYEHIRDTFGTGGNVTYNNAGIAGTPSKLGVIRLQRDVLSTDPDICFVEFAVNDGNDNDYQMAYESILRDLIERDVAVVLVFSVTESGHSCQEYMQAQGEYYGLPMISYRDALQFMFDNGKMTWRDFSDDQSHPNEAGHALVAEMINNYFDKVMEQTPEEHTYPAEPMTELWYDGVVMYDNTSVTPESLGSWETGSETAHFTDGWTHYFDANSNEPAVFKFRGKFVYMLYHEVSTDTRGRLHIKITADGEVYDEMDFDPVDPSGWGNCQVKLLALNPVMTDYEIEVSMAEGDEGKTFNILGWGVTQSE